MNEATKDILLAQHRVAAARADLHMAEAKRTRIHAEVESARALCKDASLVLHVSVKSTWQAVAPDVKWFDVADHVKSEWALRCGSAILPLVAFRGLAPAISCTRMVPVHVMEVQMEGGSTLHLRLGTGDAGEILLKARKSPPQPSSMDILKAAIGALPGLSLCAELAKFFCGETGGGRRSCGILHHELLPFPAGLKGELRPYQHIGFSWLVGRAIKGFGSLLADDMGLGKTVQCTAALLHLKQHGHLPLPALIVAPLSLTSMWAAELRRWAPSLIVHTYAGPHRQLLACAAQAPGADSRRQMLPGLQRRRLSRLVHAHPKKAATSFSGRPADVFLVSYGIFRSDVASLLHHQYFSAMILDEAQAIKNYSSQLSQAVKRLAAGVPVRIAISGTPVENRASDLHSLFEYIMPGLLGSRSSFEAMHGRPLERRGAEGRKVASLKRLTGNFMMRRMKMDPVIARDLPPKLELNHAVELTSQQADFYAHILATCMTSIARQSSTVSRLETPDQGLPDDVRDGRRDLQSSSPSASRQARAGNVFLMFHALRQVCNHPSNVDFDKWPELRPSAAPQDNVEASGKAMLLQKLLNRVFEKGEKAVVFCQYLRTVETLAVQVSSRRHVKAMTLVGDLPAEERARRVRRFQQSPGPGVLILTLAVGGVGLTLNAAAHVVHFDRCYNPSRELQGSARVHRLGQTAGHVLVHFLTSRGTFEERLEGILERKRRLGDLAAPQGEGWLAELRDDELRQAFSMTGGVAGGAAKRRRCSGAASRGGA